MVFGNRVAKVKLVEELTKVMRKALKMAFMAPDTEAAFELADLRKVSALSWQSQRKELHRMGSLQHSN